MPTWSTATDWDGAQLRQGVHDEQPAGTDWAPADKTEKGHPGSDWGATSIPAPTIYWPLDDDSSGTTPDVTGNGYTGTETGATLTTGGPLGTDYLRYDAVDDETKYTDYSFGVDSDAPLSAVYWLEVRDPGSGEDSWQFNLWQDYSYGWGTSGNNSFRPSISIYDDSKGNDTEHYPIDLSNRKGEFVFVTITVASGGEMKLYIDGALKGSGVFIDDTNIIPGDGDIVVGSRGDGSEYTLMGASDFMYWDGYELTSSEVTNLYNTVAGTSTYVSSKKQL